MFIESTPTGKRNDLTGHDSNLGKDSSPGHESRGYSAAGALQAFVEMKKSKGLDYRLTPVENAGEIWYTKGRYILYSYLQTAYIYKVWPDLTDIQQQLTTGQCLRYNSLSSCRLGLQISWRFIQNFLMAYLWYVVIKKDTWGIFYQQWSVEPAFELGVSNYIRIKTAGSNLPSMAAKKPLNCGMVE